MRELEGKAEGSTYIGRVLEKVWFQVYLLHLGRNSGKGLSGANERQDEDLEEKWQLKHMAKEVEQRGVQKEETML